MITEHDVIDLLLVVFVVEVAWAVREFVRVWRIYRDEKGWENLLFRIVVRLCGLSVLVGLIFVPIALVSLLSLPPLPFTGIGVTVGVMVLLAGVIVYGRVFQRIRARGVTIRRIGDSEVGEGVE